MTVQVQCPDLPLSLEETQRLWQAVIDWCAVSDEAVSVRCVSQATIQQLNKQYRRQDRPTNVLTVSYPPWPDKAAGTGVPSEHDVTICLAVAQREATQRKVALRDYVGLLLAHAFLHAAGLDHERSPAEAAKMQQAEQEILRKAKLAPLNL